MDNNTNMNTLENDGLDTVLSDEELEKVNGGFEYDKKVGWLKGREIKCPVCGCDTEGEGYIKGLTHLTSGGYDSVVFVCYQCRSQFEYRVGIISKRKCTAIEVKVNIRNDKWVD